MSGRSANSPMLPPPQVAEEALHVLEEASTEHLSWLKRVHCSLLFPDDGGDDDECFAAVEDGLAAKVGDRLGEGGGTLQRLKQARQHMQEMAHILTARAARGDRLDPDTYIAFMDAVEGYNAEGRQLELILHKSLAETDPLTGLYNRRGMMREVRREWVRTGRTASPCCVALADIDHFKIINDNHGHLVGDHVLSALAAFFLRRLRPYDLVFRYGGEEFLFCLPNTGIRQARRVLERLRLMTARLPIRFGDELRLTATISIGVAEVLPQEPPEAAIAQADQALYAAKADGRNRVCLANEGDIV